MQPKISGGGQPADVWPAAGYVVLFPDRLGPRGLRELCTMRGGVAATAASVGVHQ